MAYSFDPSGQSSVFSGSMRNHGSVGANLIAQLLLGHNYVPTVGNGRDMFDAFSARARQSNFLALSGGQATGQLARQFMGGSPHLTSAFSALTRDPNSMMSRFAAPLQGGNPVAASMQLYAGLTGAGVMGNFGRHEDVTLGETMKLMQTMTQGSFDASGKQVGGFYKMQSYNKERENAKVRAYIAANRETAVGTSINRAQGITELQSAADADFTATGKAGQEYDAQLARRNEMAGVLKGLQSGTDAIRQASEASAPKGEAELKKHLAEREKEIEKLTKDTLDSVKAPSEVIEAVRKKGAAAVATELTTLTTLDKKVAESRDQTAKWKGFNFDNSRGFTMEALASGFYKAADLRMMGDGRTKGLEGSMQGFMENAGGAYDAARTIWGKDKTGAELTKHMRDVIGSSSADLGSKEGSAEIEKLLRDTKSTADVAGMGIKTMLAIIDSAKQLAADNPQLQHMNSASIHKATTEAVLHAASMGGHMSNADWAAEGATQGLASSAIQSQQNYAQSSLANAQAAALSMIGGIKDPTQRKAAQDEFTKLIKSGGFTERALASGTVTARLAQVTGRTTDDVVAGMSSQTLGRAALANRAIADTVLSKEAVNGNTIAAFNDIAGSYGLGTADLIKDFASKPAEQTTEEWWADKAKHMAGDPAMAAAMAAAKPIMMNMLHESTMSEADRNALTARRDRQTAKTTELSKKYAGTNAPIMTQIMDIAMRGGSLSEASRAVAGILATRGTMNEHDSAEGVRAGTNLLQSVADAGTGNTITEAATTSVNDWLNVEGRGRVSQAELESLATNGGKISAAYGTHTAAKAAYAALKSGDNSEQAQLLRTLNTLGGFEDAGSYKTGTSGGAKNVLVTSYASSVQQSKARAQAIMDKDVRDTLQGELDVNSVEGNAAGGGKWLLNQYRGKDGTVDMERLMQDMSDKEHGKGKEIYDSLDAAGKKRLDGFTGEKIRQAQASLESNAGSADAAAQQSPQAQIMEFVVKQIDRLLVGVGSMGGAVGQLAGALGGPGGGSPSAWSDQSDD